jgi:release factor glutamine methyltransferase
VARADRGLVDAVIARGVAPAEARWLVEDHARDETPDALDRSVARRLSGEPLQYVLGHWPFRGLDLIVDPRVLIPRPETEQLVDVALRAVSQQTAGVTEIAVLDLGCGSGAIGLALVTELATRWVTVGLTALDQSVDALDVARENAARCAVRATFVHSDWYSELHHSPQGDPTTGIGRGFDLIVANPPYVSVFELDDVDPVVAYEPSSALLSGEFDGIPGFADLARIIAGAPEWLTSGGVLVCEHGTHHARAARRAAEAAGLHPVTESDLAGHERFLVALA